MDSDDILLPNAITEYVEFISQHREITYLFAKVNIFGNDSKKVNSSERNQFSYDIFNLSIKEQHNFLIEKNCIPANTLFFDREKNEKIGVICDESIPLIDDWPRWINITKKGERLYFMDKITVKYRIHTNNTTDGVLINKRYQHSLIQLWLKYRFTHDFKKSPRISIIKYIKGKQIVTHNPFWRLLEKTGRFFDPLYRAIRHSSINDWDRISTNNITLNI